MPLDTKEREFIPVLIRFMTSESISPQGDMREIATGGAEYSDPDGEIV